MKIVVVGIGYVGLSLATLLSIKNEVVALDVDKRKIDMVNKRISPLKDKEIEDYLKNRNLNLKATDNYKKAFKDAKYVIICTPTNYDDENNFFDTSCVEYVIKKYKELKCSATLVIKSTIPVGFTDYVKEEYNLDNVFFSPEFLREGKALYDNLYPSRIVIGDDTKEAIVFADLLKDSALKENIYVKFMSNKEAEAVKLFANTYLALRISFFNELDSYAEFNNLNTKNIIDGVCSDERIGDHYNNPSFGYGGYCLPKDTKQLLANYKNIPQNVIESIVNSNNTRKKYISDVVLSKKPSVIGVYRLTMKNDSDNFRESAVQDIIKILKSQNLKIIIYEPILKENIYDDCKVENNLTDFKNNSDIILANRIDNSIKDVIEKVYSRDLFNRD